MNGFVYVIENPRDRGTYKIGMTTKANPMDRIKQLNNTSMAEPFTVHIIHATDNARDLERYLHQKFDMYRVSSGREFFEMPLNLIRNELGCFISAIDRLNAVRELEESEGYVKPKVTQEQLNARRIANERCMATLQTNWNLDDQNIEFHRKLRIGLAIVTVIFVCAWASDSLNYVGDRLPMSRVTELAQGDVIETQSAKRQRLLSAMKVNPNDKQLKFEYDRFIANYDHYNY